MHAHEQVYTPHTHYTCVQIPHTCHTHINIIYTYHIHTSYISHTHHTHTQRNKYFSKCFPLCFNLTPFLTFITIPIVERDFKALLPWPASFPLCNVILAATVMSPNFSRLGRAKKRSKACLIRTMDGRQMEGSLPARHTPHTEEKFHSEGH